MNIKNRLFLIDVKIYENSTNFKMVVFFLPFQVFKNNNVYQFLDNSDVTRSNWMHYTNFAYTAAQQNLIACQIDFNIYFYTTKPIPPNTELMVWYCREYADRLNCPLTGEEMLQNWSKLQLFPLINKKTLIL